MLSLLASALVGASTVSAVTHTVLVGDNLNRKFHPNELSAAVGDVVRFDFFANNHSVTQGSFDDPCQPLAGGFFSGFKVTETALDPGPTRFEITINNTDPIYVYCGVHCPVGMVLGINT